MCGPDAVSPFPPTLQAFYISSMFKPCARPNLSPASTTQLESPLSSQQTVC